MFFFIFKKYYWTLLKTGAYPEGHNNLSLNRISPRDDFNIKCGINIEKI